MTRYVLALLAALALSSAACAGTSGHVAPPATLPPCAADDEGCRAERLGDDAMGWLRMGLSPAELEARLGPPEEVGPTFEEGATGLWVHERVWNAAGVVVQLAATTEGGPQGVNSFTVSAPFDGRSARGIGVGSAEAEVLAAYGDVLDPHSVPGERVIAGSLYGGMIFYLEDGVVTAVFAGAAAE